MGVRMRRFHIFRHAFSITVLFVFAVLVVNGPHTVALAIRPVTNNGITQGKPATTSAKRKGKVRRTSAKVRRKQIIEAERRLSELGYWTGPVDGVPDVGLRHALIAFQKVEGRKITGKLTFAELAALRTASTPQPLDSSPSHVEIDLTRQVLFIVGNDGRVTKILPTSTGNDKWFTTGDWTRQGCTPCGRFRIYRKIPGWRKSELGLLYYPNYIAGGIAIHGYRSVPTYPASHGCIRIPMYAAKEFSNLTPVAMPVLVYVNERKTAAASAGSCCTYRSIDTSAR